MPPRCLHGEVLSRQQVMWVSHSQETTGPCGGSAHVFFGTGREGVCVVVKHVSFWHRGGYRTCDRSWSALPDLPLHPQIHLPPTGSFCPTPWPGADPQWAISQILIWLLGEFARGDALAGYGRREFEGMSSLTPFLFLHRISDRDGDTQQTQLLPGPLFHKSIFPRLQ